MCEGKHTEDMAMLQAKLQINSNKVDHQAGSHSTVLTVFNGVNGVYGIQRW
jgi:hypothetical protein